MRSNAELFEILKGMHVPGFDEKVDQWVELCVLRMERESEDEITRSMIENTIAMVVTNRDRAEILAQRCLMTPEEREICEALERMTDDELRNVADSAPPDLRDHFAALLLYRDETRRLEAEIRTLGRSLDAGAE